MNSFRDMKLLRNLVRSQERKKYYSTNTSKIINTYKCPEHNEYFSKICLKCNIDICPRCDKNYHYSHKTIKYEDANPDYVEIENLQKVINIYIDKYNSLRKEINNWYTDLKNKIYDFELSLKNNDIVNSLDFIINYHKNKISLNSIIKFRKIYYNLIEENNTKNKKIISLINQYGNNENLNIPIYYDFSQIKTLLQNLNFNKDFTKKGQLILNYLSKIPYIENNSIIYNNNTNEVLSKSSSFYNLSRNPLFFSNDLKNWEILKDKSTWNKNSNETNKTNSEKIVIDSKVSEFKNILNKTKIPEFNLNENYNNKLNKTTLNSDKKNYSVTDFKKYLNKMGLLNMNENDLHRVNSSQDLFNKSSFSIKSSKYIHKRNNINNPFFISKNKTQSNTQETRSPVYSYTSENRKIENQNKKHTLLNNLMHINKNIQTKTYVHKKFSNNNNINNKKSNIIKFQKKLIIINKSNKSNKHNHNNNIQYIKKEDIKENPNNNENKNIVNNENKSNNTNLINQKIVRTKQINDDIFNNNEKKEKEYSSPIKTDLFKNAIISDAKKNIINDYDNDNEESNINTTEKKNLLKIIFSPSNKEQSTNKKINPNINNNTKFQTYKIRNSLNMNFTPPNIVKSHKNSPFFIDPDKEVCIGLELGDSECKAGIVNQNTSEIQLVCFEEDKYSIPTMISFGQNKKEIKIGYRAEEDILNNPSQTIFGVLKFFGKKYCDGKGKNELLPFKIYNENNEENKPYIKMNFGPQKDKIFYFENILSIFLQKIFEIIFNKVNIENSSNYNTQEKLQNESEEDSYKNIIILNTILVLTVPNYFTYYQRKLIESIIKNEIFPEINIVNTNENSISYGKYKINLLEVKIENASSIASICLNPNYDYNIVADKSKSKNILILNIDGGSTNISVTNTLIDKEKQVYQVKAINGLQKGESDFIDNFMFGILQKFDNNIKKEILDSPLALVKFRKICKQIKINLMQKEKTLFNIVDILDNYDWKIEINRYEYENYTCNLFNEIKSLIYETLNKSKIKENRIDDIIFIGEICRDKNISQIVEQLFRQDNSIYEELIYSNYMDNEKDNYIVGGASYHALNLINNNIYIFYDISPFNIGIKKYNGELNFIINKGEKIPVKNNKSIKIDNENELKIYEKYDNENNKEILIGKVELNNIKMNNSESNTKYGFREIKFEYEINDKLDIFISIFNGEKYEDKIKINLLYIDN